MPTWFAPILTFGVGASFFAVVVAPLNVVGRIVYVMGKEGVVGDHFGRTHDRHLTPHRVLLIAGPTAIALNVVLLAMSVDPMHDRRVGGHLRHLRLHGRLRTRRDRLRGVHAARGQCPTGWCGRAAIVVVLAMAYAFFANVWPVPAWPLNVIPYLFLVTMLAAVAWYLVLAHRRPEIVGNIGKTETDVLDGVG